jgi:hypothetical protein
MGMGFIWINYEWWYLLIYFMGFLRDFAGLEPWYLCFSGLERENVVTAIETKPWR